jgi:hypothetical protein
LLQRFVIVPGEAYTLSPYEIYQVSEFSVFSCSSVILKKELWEEAKKMKDKDD